MNRRLSRIFGSKWIKLALLCELILLAAMILHFSNYVFLFLFILFSAASITFSSIYICRRGKKSGRFIKAAFSLLSIALFICATIMCTPCHPKQKLSYADNIDVPRPSVFSGKNVLIISPHEDDELHLNGIIQQYIAEKSSVRVAFVTNGDYYDDGLIRIRESVSVLTAMGVPEENIIFLGYGDQWSTEFGHIYNAPSDALVTSHIGRTETYGTEAHPPFSSSAYTRANLISDMRSLILGISPDTIYCADYDSHPDHRSTSLIFEEAMSSILSEGSDYTPSVCKYFLYTSGWFGDDDYYSLNTRSTVRHSETDGLQEISVYNWSERERLPLAAFMFSRTLFDSPLFVPYTGYSSQDAFAHASRAINGDCVFWHRNTQSLTYSASVTATSGNPELLNDFKLYDSSRVFRKKASPDTGVWHPDLSDNEKSITITLSSPAEIRSVTLYDDYSPDNNITDAQITLSNGYSFRTGALDRGGSSTDIDFECQHGITSATVKILSYEGNPGLTELELYSDIPAPQYSFAKLEDSEGNFAYDYIISSDTCVFGVYSVGCSDTAFTASCDNSECSAVVSADGKVLVTCPKNEECHISLFDSDGVLYDKIRVSHLGSFEKFKIRLAQQSEKFAYEIKFGRLREYYDELFKAFTVDLCSLFS